MKVPRPPQSQGITGCEHTEHRFTDKRHTRLFVQNVKRKPAHMHFVLITVISHQIMNTQNKVSPLLHCTKSLFGDFHPIFPRDIFLDPWLFYLLTDRAS